MCLLHNTGKTYGYDSVRKLDSNGQLIKGLRTINENEKKIVRQIFSLFTKDHLPPHSVGYNTVEICDILNRDGIPSPQGGKWNNTVLLGTKSRGTGILRNTLYIGVMTFDKVSYVKDPSTGKRVSRSNPPEKWIQVPIPELAIIDEDTFQKAKERIDSPANYRKTQLKRMRPQTKTKLNQNFYVSSGKFSCGECGSFLSPTRGGEIKCKNENCIIDIPFKRDEYLLKLEKSLKSFSFDHIKNYENEEKHKEYLADLKKIQVSIEELKLESFNSGKMIAKGTLIEEVGAVILRKNQAKITELETLKKGIKKKIKILTVADKHMIVKRYHADLKRYFNNRDHSDLINQFRKFIIKAHLKKGHCKIEFNLDEIVDFYLR